MCYISRWERWNVNWLLYGIASDRWRWPARGLPEVLEGRATEGRDGAARQTRRRVHRPLYWGASGRSTSRRTDGAREAPVRATRSGQRGGLQRGEGAREGHL